MSFNPETLASLADIVCITGKIAFCKTEIMQCIQQVGFSNAIFTANSNYPFFYIKRGRLIIFELNQA